MAKCILRNDYWCKGIGQSQPKSDAYIRFKEIKKAKKEIK
jgi:predicted phosphoadenosine phosphosulfate sulfurtransferase